MSPVPLLDSSIRIRRTFKRLADETRLEILHQVKRSMERQHPRHGNCLGIFGAQQVPVRSAYFHLLY